MRPFLILPLTIVLGSLLLVGCKESGNGGPAFGVTDVRTTPGQCSARFEPAIVQVGQNVGATLADLRPGRYTLKKVVLLTRVESWNQVQSEMVTEDLLLQSSCVVPGGGMILTCASGATLGSTPETFSGWIHVPQVVDIGSDSGRIWQERQISHVIENSNPRYCGQTQGTQPANWKDLDFLHEELWGYQDRCARSNVYQLSANLYEVVKLSGCGLYGGNSPSPGTGFVARYRAQYEWTQLVQDDRRDDRVPRRRPFDEARFRTTVR